MGGIGASWIRAWTTRDCSRTARRRTCTALAVAKSDGKTFWVRAESFSAMDVSIRVKGQERTGRPDHPKQPGPMSFEENAQ